MCAELSGPGAAAGARWSDVAEALRDGRVEGAEAGEVFETHISYVIVGERLVHKLKKPVTLPYVDYSTSALRRAMCQREHELNSRLAANLYLGVRGVLAEGDGFALCDADDASCIEHVVAMRRVDRDETLERRVDTLAAQPHELAAVGRRLAEFHLDAHEAPPPAGTPERLRDWLMGKLGHLRTAPQGLLDPVRVEAMGSFFERWLHTNEGLLRERIAAGHVRDGHGDLRMDHVVLRDGSVAVLDCVEFDDALRHNDVLADLSFLAMELQYAGREDLTRALIEAWSDAGGPLDERLLWAYASSRALIRVEVGLTRVEQLRQGGPSLELKVAEERTQALLDLAVRLSWRARQPVPILFAGLSGSGKTRISQILARQWGLERVSSDEVRKRLVGVGRNDPAPDHAYDDWVSRDVYERLGHEAAREVTAGRSVLVDATFRRPVDAQAFVRAFRAAGALESPITLACTAPDEVLRARMHDRAESGGSDAGLDVLEAQLRDAGPFTVGISNTIELATDRSLAATLEAAEAFVLDLTVGRHRA
ncbi:MAG: AAA family ATPase [Solirubrobacteraceae bacterium]